MFGIDNIGVINQRNAPAIWESAVADFPTNNIQGRMLLATDTVTLYVDLVNGNGGMSNRAVIASGLIGNGNGTTINNTGSGDYSVDLGGDLLNTTEITMNGFVLTFVGSIATFNIENTGNIFSSFGDFLPANDIGLQSVIPNTTLRFKNVNTGDSYDVLAKIV